MEVKKLTPEMVTALRQPLPPQAIAPHPTKDYLSTIKVIYVVERLNDVFGLGGWTVKNEIIEAVADKKMVVVKATLTAGEYGIVQEAFGGNDNSDRGDAYKGACTDALSKIGSYLYIGMDVYKGLGDKPSKEAKKSADKPAADAKAPIKLRGKVEKMSTKDTADGTELYALIKGLSCFSGTEPNRTKVLNAFDAGLEAEFVVMPTDRVLNGKPLFSIHMVSPIPTVVPDDKLKPALAVSISEAKAARQ